MCEICGRSPCVPRCPNYLPHKTKRQCSVCGCGIFGGEEYIENCDGEYMHYGCVQGIRQLLDWLGYDITECNEDEDDYAY